MQTVFYVNLNAAYFEKDWLENCPSDCKPCFYRRCVDGIVLFTSRRTFRSLPKFSFGMFFLDAQIREDKTSLLSSKNLPVAEFIHILAAFYRLHINLVLFKHSLDASKYAQVGLNYTLNYFFKNKISDQMATFKILSMFQKIYG